MFSFSLALNCLRRNKTMHNLKPSGNRSVGVAVSNRWSQKLYATWGSATSRPSCSFMSSSNKYRGWNFFLLIPHHVASLFIALLEAIPHQLLASSSREASLFQSVPCGGCWCQASSRASLVLAVLKDSFRAQTREIHKSSAAELRALDGAAVLHGFFVMFLNRLRPIQEIIGLELTLDLDLRSQNFKWIDTLFF